jgi:hypothetical protein
MSRQGRRIAARATSAMNKAVCAREAAAVSRAGTE